LTLNRVEATGSPIVESDLFTIGDLARASGLSVSALRFYDRVGILPPAHVDPVTGYRWYAPVQIRPACVIAVLRRVAMPLAEISRVLAEPAEAPALLAAHLGRLERGLADARRELSRVRTLIEPEESFVMNQEATSRTVSAAALAAAFDSVRFAASTDPELPMLAGVLVELAEGEVRLVATDRYRLAVATASVEGGAGAAAQAVAPVSWVDEVRPLLAGDGPAGVTINGGELTVDAGGRSVTGAPITTEFPDYRRLLPAGGTRRVTVDPTRLAAGLAAAAGGTAVLTVGVDDTVGLEPGAGTAAGPATPGTPATPAAPGEMRIGINPTFLLQAFTAAGGGQLVLELDTPKSPMVLRPARSGPGTFSLLMPVALP
jgi:DNA polymerase-3 subunit beta